MVKKVVITGATSFIGVHLIKEWLKEDVEIFAIVRPNSKHIDRIPKDKNIQVCECKMSEYKFLTKRISTADYFYHLAWEGARTPHRDDESIQKNNYKCAVQAMQVAVELGCTFFLGTGSQAEYGLMDGVVNETSQCNPNTAYGKEKLHACLELQRIAKQTGIKFIWVRIFSLYGKYDYSETFIMSAIRKMKKNEPIEMTRGIQLWDYLHVEDATKAMKMFALKICESGIYNIASGDYKPLNQFIKLMKKVIGSKSVLKFGAVPYGENGPINLMPNPEKVKKTLGWSPSITFEEGVRKLCMEMSS